MAENEIKIKRCPFCEASGVICKKMYNNVVHRYRIQCNNAGCSIRTPWLCYLEDAVEVWNRRAESSLLQRFKEFAGSQGYDLVISDSGISIKDLVESLNSMPITEPSERE